MRKPTFCICENKDADQLRGNREADQRLCFRYLDSMIPLLSKSENSSLWPSPVAVQPGLCRTRSETRMLVFSRRGSFKRKLYVKTTYVQFIVVSRFFLESSAYPPYFVKISLFNSDANIYSVYKCSFFKSL